MLLIGELDAARAREAMCKVYMLKCLHDVGDSEDWEKYKEYGEFGLQDLHKKFMDYLKKKFDFNDPLCHDFHNFKSKGKYLQSLNLRRNNIEDDGTKELLKVLRENLFFNLNLDNNKISKEFLLKYMKMQTLDFFLLTCDIFNHNSNYNYRLINLSIMNNEFSDEEINYRYPIGHIPFRKE